MSFPPVQPLSLKLEALATQGNGSSRVFESITATLSPFSGTVVLDMGYEIVNPARVIATAQVQGGHAPWTYRFLPDVDGTLTFHFDIRGPANIRFLSSGHSFETLHGSGTLTRDLVAGRSFTMALDLFAGPNCGGIW